MFNPVLDPPGYLTGPLECLVGIVFFPTVFFLIQLFLKQSWLGGRICRRFQLKTHGIYDVSNKLTSSTFAILACWCGVYVYSRCGEDALHERFPILDNYLVFGVSYFFYDCVTMYMVFSTESEETVTVSTQQIIRFCCERPLIILHHLLVPLLGFPAMMFARGGRGDCLLGTAYLVEASTPFVSFRVILCHLGLKESRLYLMNGVLMLVTFFLCRVCIFPVLYIWYIRLEGVAGVFTAPIWVHLAVAGLWFPQLVWFAKMIKGAIKLLKDSRHQKVQ